MTAGDGPGPSAFRVRELAPAEADELGRLTVAAYAPLPGFEDAHGYLATLGDVGRRATEAVVLVAVDPDGRLLGGVTYVPGPGPFAEFDDPSHAGIRMLAVAAEARGRGVGTALVRACVERARIAGRARVWLHTMDAMAGARRIYEREGFRRAPEADWVGDLCLLAYALDLFPGPPPSP
ncbi:MAG: GNAT family N-acetyltransferase [Acidimicrobiales bacterium]